MEKDLQGQMDTRHKWLSKIPFETLVKDIQCTCKGECVVAAKSILPYLMKEQVIVWNSCAKTLFAAIKRHLLAVPHPDQSVMSEWYSYCNDLFRNEIVQFLKDFQVDPEKWFNHLTLKQQKEILTKEELINPPKEYKHLSILKNPSNTPQHYCMFCKRELQIVEKPEMNYHGSVLPKNRAICGPCSLDKAITGPVTWNLEALFAKKFKGYCGGKNWEEMELSLTRMWDEGYRYVMFGDGSGWDRTQSHELKYIDRLIYDYVVDNTPIDYVDREVLRTKLNSRYRRVNGKVFENGIAKTLFSCQIDATVTSGNTDTTLMNTIRMATVNRFLMDKTGLDYDLWCKGDDFIIFLKNEVNLKDLYYKYWAKKDEKLNEEHGLGIILKFLKVTPMSDFDFCSTNVIQEGNKFKMVRLPEKMSILSSWSMKATGMSNFELKQYLLDLATGLDKWVGEMPFYSDFRNLFEEVAAKVPIDKKKKKVQKFLSKIQLGDKSKHNSALENQLLEKGHDFYHSHKLRTSQSHVSNQAVYRYFLERYSVTRLEIKNFFEKLRAGRSAYLDLVSQ